MIASSAASIAATAGDLVGHAALLAAEAAGLVSGNVLAIGAIGAGIFLAGEVLARTSPVRDPRKDYLARRLAIEPDQIVPIGDGFQLWRDARELRGEDRPDVVQAVPTGAPTLLGTYLALSPQGLILICVHRYVEGRFWEDGDEAGIGLAGAYMFEPVRGSLTPRLLEFSVDEDIRRKVALVEALARGRFGVELRGEIHPLVLYTGRHRDGSPGHPSPLRSGRPTEEGVEIAHVDFGDDKAFVGYTSRLAARRSTEDEERAFFDAFAPWVVRQPARVTPRRKILRRAAFGAAFLAGWMLQGPGLGDAFVAQAASLVSAILF